MKSRNRSLTGAIIAAFMLPVFVGLLACLPTFPVPVGDPEKSRIDPEISGMWLLGEDTVMLIYLFEPYDKRTWLISAFAIEEDSDACDFDTEFEPANESEDEEPEPTPYESMVGAIEEYGSDCFKVDNAPSAMKAWRTKLGGEWFMTWEDKGVFRADGGFEVEKWIVFRIDKSVPDVLKLWVIDDSHDSWDVFADVDDSEITRRQVERVIRKHASDEEFYVHDDDFDEMFTYYRIQPEHYELFEDFTNGDMFEW